jgi:hypothetical protein
VNRSLTTIVGFGIIAAIFLAVLSVFYLQQIPNQEDMVRLETDLRREHNLFFDATAPIEIALVMPEKEGQPIGVRISCTFRADVRKKPETVDTVLDRIGESALEHPDWRGRVGYAHVVHTPIPARERTVEPKTETADLGDKRSKG